MDVLVFYKVGGYLLLINSYLEEESVFVEGTVFDELIDMKKYSSRSLLEKFGLDEFKEKGEYIFVETDDFVFFQKSNFMIRLMLFVDKKEAVNFIMTNSEALIYKFKHKRKDDLINSVSKPDISLNEYVGSLCEYVFCEHFSIWTFNEETSVFTCEVSSFDCEDDHVKADDDCAFVKMIDSENFFQSKEIINGMFNSNSLKNLEMNWVNRVKLDVGGDGGIKAIASFYTRKKNFCINDENARKVKSFLESKYIENVQVAEEQFEVISDKVSLNVQKETLDDYFIKFITAVCEDLKYEAGSIFLLGEEGFLNLRATFDRDGCRVCNGDTFYKKDKESMTSKVFNTGEVWCAYDLNGFYNSHTYDEPTENTAKNWIGCPIIIDGETIGVLRVKNKYVYSGERKLIRPPRPLHFENLLRLVEVLSLSIDIYRKYEDLNGDLEEQNNFNRVLLHEIRTPISKFNMGPEIIKKGLMRESIPDERKNKYLRQLDDIKVLGGRLKHITDSYNFEALLKVKVEKRIPLLSGVVYPIVNITRPYLEKQHECILDVNLGSFHSWLVKGDKNLYTMALNALVDNAAKYYYKDKRIKVYCEYNYGEEFLYIYVENRGFLIDDDERDLVFGNSYRGRTVSKEKIHGTGIGLYLAKKIMVDSGGDLYIVPKSDPNKIVFCMKVPVSDNLVDNHE
ncbi:ATP-binding protein [Neptuniibacter sp. QD72_48]|uniref:GAF domain-containing sensor histidine kinase n=1 Tax=Neptuniibacter sp. QD72_48 TaxID=3398214 RepID=UPI0039F4A220